MKYPRVCPECGKSFEANSARSVYCCDDCRRKAINKRQAENYQAKRSPGMLDALAEVVSVRHVPESNDTQTVITGSCEHVEEPQTSVATLPEMDDLAMALYLVEYELVNEESTDHIYSSYRERLLYRVLAERTLDKLRQVMEDGDD